jgi:glycosyltransferase involved in cell wall biosynthesis
VTADHKRAGAPDVTVVIPSFNARMTLPRALASVEAQSLLPSELICVDDASSDDSVLLLQEFASKASFPVQVEALPCNVGAALARNHGISRASSGWIAFLDSDDAWHPRKLELQLALAATSGADLIGGYSELDAGKFDDADMQWRDLGALEGKAVGLRGAVFSNPFHTSTVLARTGPKLLFPADRHAEDFALWLQLLRDGAHAVQHGPGLARMYKPPYGDSGLSARLWAMERGELSALARGCRDQPWLLPPAAVLSLVKFGLRLAGSALR